MITHREHTGQAIKRTPELGQCKIVIAVQAADGSGLFCSKFRIPLQLVPVSYRGLSCENRNVKIRRRYKWQRSPKPPTARRSWTLPRAPIAPSAAKLPAS